MNSTSEAKGDSNREFPAIETTLLRIVVVFRIVGAAWLTSLAVLILLTEKPRIDLTQRTVIIWSAIGVAVTWTLVTLVFAYRYSGIGGFSSSTSRWPPGWR